MRVVWETGERGSSRGQKIRSHVRGQPLWGERGKGVEKSVVKLKDAVKTTAEAAAAAAAAAAASSTTVTCRAAWFSPT